jgi:hypothetical protein
LLRALRFCRPHFQLTILEWQHFANGAVSVDRGGRWKQNQMIGQMTEEHYSEIYDADREQAPTSGKNL